MEETIEGINNKLVLTTEEEEEAILDDKITRISEISGKLCLVGKLLTKKAVNFEALRTTLHFMWKTTKGFNCKTIKENTFLFQFKHMVDKQRVMANGPGMRLSMGNSEPLWVDFKYERLPLFCYHCGIIGHNENECEKLSIGVQREAKRDQQYGHWLRARSIPNGDKRKNSPKKPEILFRGKVVQKGEVSRGGKRQQSPTDNIDDELAGGQSMAN
ncbi:hypothetical protein U1Q18_022340 [Sarracenia purpurea var. burkii]